MGVLDGVGCRARSGLVRNPYLVRGQSAQSLKPNTPNTFRQCDFAPRSSSSLASQMVNDTILNIAMETDIVCLWCGVIKKCTSEPLSRNLNLVALSGAVELSRYGILTCRPTHFISDFGLIYSSDLYVVVAEASPSNWD